MNTFHYESAILKIIDCNNYVSLKVQNICDYLERAINIPLLNPFPEK